MLHISHDPHNLANGGPGTITHQQPPADRIFIWKVTARPLLIDNRHRSRMAIISVGKRTSFQESNSHSTEVIGTGNAIISQQALARWRQGLSLNSKAGAALESAKW